MEPKSAFRFSIFDFRFSIFDFRFSIFDFRFSQRTNCRGEASEINWVGRAGSIGCLCPTPFGRTTEMLTLPDGAKMGNLKHALRKEGSSRDLEGRIFMGMVLECESPFFILGYRP